MSLISILRSIENPIPVRHRKSPWSPPFNWKFSAARLHPDEREEYTRRCEEWHAAHPPRPPPVPPVPKPNFVNINMFNAAFKKYGAVIPINELIRIGYTSEQINLVVARRKWYKDHHEELTKKIDKIWPGVKVKPKKVIKAVNKRMPGGIENV
jgi:cbb3-type cytochrome oxidase cytochrome c subunit